jgi:hypothetical protein
MKIKKSLPFKYENKEDWMPSVLSAKNVIPKWYKSTQNVELANVKSLPLILNIKACIPFLDALTSGYMLTTPMDLAIRVDGGIPIFTWHGGDINPVVVRDPVLTGQMPIPHGYNTTHFVWNTATAFKLPKGYSCLVTHPLNRFDLPFITLSGVIDGDAIFHQGNIPFFVKDGFEGIIKRGTPIMQIIPFKRENWKLEKEEGLIKKGHQNVLTSFAHTVGWYKKNSWKRKNYE